MRKLQPISFQTVSKDCLLQFWKSSEKRPCMVAFLAEPAFTRPLALHGDAALTVSVGNVWAKCKLCFFWHSVLRFKHSKATSFYIWSAP